MPVDAGSTSARPDGTFQMALAPGEYVFEARANTRPGNGPLGTESQAEARLGMQIRASGLRFDFAGITGLTSFSPNSGFTVGVTYDTPSVFAPVK